jgi:hypothetical protein
VKNLAIYIFVKCQVRGKFVKTVVFMTKLRATGCARLTKTTLETSGEDVKTPPETGGEDLELHSKRVEKIRSLGLPSVVYRPPI